MEQAFKVIQNCICLTPAMIGKVYEKHVSHDIEKKPVTIRGIYQDRNRGIVKGHSYDILKDETSEARITVRIPEALRQILKNGRSYVMRGVMDARMSWHDSLGVNLMFMAQEIIGEEKPINDNAETIRNLFALKAKRDHDISSLLHYLISKGVKPRIAILTGTQAIVLNDIIVGLGKKEKLYFLEIKRANFADKNAIIKAVKEADSGCHLLAIARGGGDSLDVFDDPGIAHAIVSSRIPVVTALGHASNHTLADQAADKSFPVPHALGVFLREACVCQDQEEHHEEPVYSVWRPAFAFGMGVITVLVFLAVL